jgi:YD repeat-containing protein
VEPSVKGSLLLNCAVAMRRHRDAGRVSEDELAARLGAAALELLDQKIDISRWYPIDAFCEMVDMDWEISAGRNPDYARRMGKDSAARFFHSGIYQQLDYAKRVTRVESRSALVRQSRLITTVTNALYNFMEIEVRVEGDCLVISFENAAAFSEALRYTTEGFMDEINRQQGSARRWSSERVRPDRVRFELDLPKRLHGD